jgi:uncharacterized membrane protein YphA (DoxX/SURF4 family)
MNLPDTHQEECWVSLILRLAVASLFAAAVIPKWSGGLAGLDGIVANFRETFKDTWLPAPLVVFQARLIPYVEALLPVWLLVGWKLRIAWVITALFLVTLSFGMLVAQQGDVAAHNFAYVLIACWGLYFSKYDRLSIDAPGKQTGA